MGQKDFNLVAQREERDHTALMARYGPDDGMTVTEKDLRARTLAYHGAGADWQDPLNPNWTTDNVRADVLFHKQGVQTQSSAFGRSKSSLLDHQLAKRVATHICHGRPTVDGMSMANQSHQSTSDLMEGQGLVRDLRKQIEYLRRLECS